MDLRNLFKVVMYYLLIKGMIGLRRDRDEVPMVNSLVCMVIY